MKQLFNDEKHHAHKYPLSVIGFWLIVTILLALQLKDLIAW